jgi:acyl-ACP thioesterase
MDPILFMPFKVTSADTDMHSRIRIGALVNLLIQSAINSADNLNAGFEDIRQQKLFWVLSRLTLEIRKPLTWYQSGKVETWPKDVEKILYLRDFIVRDDDLEIIALATSGWLAVDLATKRPKMLQGVQYSIFNELRDKHALTDPPEKLFPVGSREAKDISTTYYDIDLNGHVTACRYIDWMMDFFPLEFHRLNYPRQISVNYLSETRVGETIRLNKETDGKTFFFEGTNPNRGVSAFRGKILF